MDFCLEFRSVIRILQISVGYFEFISVQYGYKFILLQQFYKRALLLIYIYILSEIFDIIII
jgi:hypothetical protein